MKKTRNILIGAAVVLLAAALIIIGRQQATDKLNMLDPKTLQAADFYDLLESLPEQYERAMGYVQRFRLTETAAPESAPTAQIAAQSAFQQLAQNMQQLRRQADMLTEHDE